MMDHNKRIEWIDAVKGFGMILVILGHMTIPELVRRCIFSFHMPLFFFISGYLYGGGYSLSWVGRKAKALLIPYIVYGLIAIGVIWLTNNGCIASSVQSFIRGNGVGVTWFLSCLFMVEMIGGGLIMLSRKFLAWQYWLMVVGVAVVGIIFPRLALCRVMKSEALFAGLAFWLVGYGLKGVGLNWKWFAGAFIPATFVWLQRVDMQSASFGNPVIFYLVALAAVLVVVYLFSRLNITWCWLKFVGERSLEFMCVHAIIPMLVVWAALNTFGDITPTLKGILRVLTLCLVVVISDFAYRMTRRSMR